MRLTLPVPDYSTVSRRQGALQVRESLIPRSGPRHVVIDATGLRVYGAGEWYVWKHRVNRRRTWRKLHLGVDERSKEVVAVELTESRVHDSQQLPALLEQIPEPIDQVSGDGAYDTRACYEAVLHRGAMPIFVPRCTARPCATKDPTGWRAARNRILQQIEAGDARRGGCSVDVRGRASPRIRFSDSSGCSEGDSGRGVWRPNVPKQW